MPAMSTGWNLGCRQLALVGWRQALALGYALYLDSMRGELVIVQEQVGKGNVAEKRRCAQRHGSVKSTHAPGRTGTGRSLSPVSR